MTRSLATEIQQDAIGGQWNVGVHLSIKGRINPPGRTICSAGRISENLSCKTILVGKIRSETSNQSAQNEYWTRRTHVNFKVQDNSKFPRADSLSFNFKIPQCFHSSNFF